MILERSIEPLSNGFGERPLLLFSGKDVEALVGFMHVCQVEMYRFHTLKGVCLPKGGCPFIGCLSGSVALAWEEVASYADEFYEVISGAGFGVVAHANPFCFVGKKELAEFCTILIANS